MSFPHAHLFQTARVSRRHSQRVETPLHMYGGSTDTASIRALASTPNDSSAKRHPMNCANRKSKPSIHKSRPFRIINRSKMSSGLAVCARELLKKTVPTLAIGQHQTVHHAHQADLSNHFPTSIEMASGHAVRARDLTKESVLDFENQPTSHDAPCPAPCPLCRFPCPMGKSRGWCTGPLPRVAMAGPKLTYRQATGQESCPASLSREQAPCGAEIGVQG